MHTFAVAAALRLSCACFRGARVRGGAAAVVAPLCVMLETAVAIHAVAVRRAGVSFCRWHSGRVGLGRVSPTGVAQNFKKKVLFCHSATTAMAMAAAIRNPQRHRYLVAFFQKPLTPYRHGTAITDF